MNRNDVLVTVICDAYNHEKYIRDCLEGFVMQKTNFNFEVIVHDDASTDNTASIIKEYEDKYPNIIKPIYETENKYSKGISIKKIEEPYVKGKYIAICEGDDCWTHPFKLQKQVDFLENNLDYSACVHNAVTNDRKGMQKYHSSSNITRDYSTNELIEMGGGSFATNSIMVKKNIFFEIPKCFYCPGVGDYQLFVYASICGKFHYMLDVMSQYNRETEGSWTYRVYNDLEKRRKHFEEMIKMLKNVDEYYNGKYTESINKVITRLEFNVLNIKDDKRKMLDRKYRDLLFSKLSSKKGYIKFVLYAYLPNVMNYYDKVRHRGNN